MEPVIRGILFLLVVNALPALAHVALGDRLRTPVDCGYLWRDQKTLFGKNKTIRGLVVSVAGGMALMGLLQQPWWVGGFAALLAMAGDLATSFVKRRWGLASGRAVFGFDQLLESLLPLLFLAPIMHLSLGQSAIILFLFILVAYIFSTWWIYTLYRPPVENYPRIIRSTVRLREWRACHTPLARYQVWFNLTRVLTDQVVLTWLFKISGLYARGVSNALDVRLTEKTMIFEHLPGEFDNFTILFLTDLHLDGLQGLTEKLVSLVGERSFDLCLLGGDIRMKLYGPMAPALRELRKVVAHIDSREGILGVLGNHDCIEMIPDFEEVGITMLINDASPITRGSETVWIVGVDDPHYYKLDDAKQAYRAVPDHAFSLFLAHSPESFSKASSHNADLYLCGHTHGGQICFSEMKPVLTNSRAPRSTASGEWRYGTMRGFTSRGVGVSSIPVRFNCPGEVCVLTLRRAESGVAGQQPDS